MKNKIVVVIIVALAFVVVLMPLKGSYAFYTQNKELSIINTEVGNWKSSINYLDENAENNDLNLQIEEDIYR